MRVARFDHIIVGANVARQACQIRGVSAVFSGQNLLHADGQFKAVLSFDLCRPADISDGAIKMSGRGSVNLGVKIGITGLNAAAQPGEVRQRTLQVLF